MKLVIKYNYPYNTLKPTLLYRVDVLAIQSDLSIHRSHL